MKTLNNLLDKKERKKIYMLALKKACADPDVKYGLCYFIYRAMLDKGYPIYQGMFSALNNPEYFFPEFWSIKPKNKKLGQYWWPRTKKG